MSAGMTALSKLPATIASRYIPIRLIGQGGMGAVYEVEHVRTGDHLALKVLLSSVGASADALERFKREARASARIKSDHVVRVTDADVAPELDGAPFLVMELLQGMDLERAAASKTPTAAEVVGWLGQIAPAIDKAHRLGIVHRDLKPENLFLATSDDGPTTVKVLDFGIAKMVEEGIAATGSGQLLGTPKYMAPEQATANPRITPATDLYALGLIAYRLIVGESYYQGDNVIGILGELIHGQLKPPSERNPKMTAAFDTWFLKACAREPGARFGSAADQIEALASALGLPALVIARPGEQSSDPADRPRLHAAQTTQVTPETLDAARSNPPKARRIAPLVAGAVALAVVAAAVVVVAGRSGDKPKATPSPAGAAPATAKASPEPPAVASPPSARTTPPPGGPAAPSVPVALPAAKSSADKPRGRGKARPSEPRAAATGPKPSGADPFSDQK